MKSEKVVSKKLSLAVRGCLGLSALLSTLVLASAAQAQVLAPYKDHLFKSGKVLQSADEGRVITIDYNEMRDVNGRDEIPVKKAKSEYVSLDVVREQRRLNINGVDTFEVGNPSGARFAVIFIHGAGGDATLGANDWTFSGNFNRLKNLAVLNDGVYYSPSMPAFGETGARSVEVILDRVLAASPKAKIIVACGSAGSTVCWSLTKKAELANKISGLMIVGGFTGGGNVRRNVAIQSRLPIYFAHGTRDSVVGPKRILKQYQELRSLDPDYPIRVTLYESGIHGTPIRMIDWKESINWMLSAR